MRRPIRNSFPNNSRKQARGKCNDSSFFRGEPAAGAQVITLDPNETDPVRGTTYAQQALDGLRKHATQGPWPKTVPASGARPIRYNLVKQAPNSTALPANAKTPVDGLVLPQA